MSEWRDRPGRKPLVLRGARQVGKTYLVEHWGAEHFASVMTVDLERERDLHSLFSQPDPKRVLAELGVLRGRSVTPGKTLLFLDEIQACPPALALLRYFHELLPELHVIAAGPLLDFALREFEYSMPVGRIEFLHLQPMSFEEFVAATEGEALVEYLKTWRLAQPPSEAVAAKFLEAVRRYFFVGGMPEAVAAYAARKDLLEVQRIQTALVETMQADFAKYGPRRLHELMRQTYRHIAENVGRKIKFVNISREERSADVRRALELARHSDMRLTMKTYTDAGQLPLREVMDSLPGFGERADSRIDSRNLGAAGQTVSPTVTKIREMKTKNSLANTGASHRDSSLVTTSHVKSEWRREGVMLKILRSVFTAARREGLIDDNPAERVTTLKRRTDFERRPFTLPELKRLMELAVDEWRGMILFGLYTGQRLGDIATLTKVNLDLGGKEIRLTTGKTGRRQILPLAGPLLKFIKKLPASDDPAGPLFPRAHAVVQRQGRAGNLSNQFHKILVAAGLADKRSHPSTGKGRNVSREQNEISFHSLRHTATTLLKSAGVSDAVAREFIGHDSPTVSKQYTHIPTDTLRQAANKLPDIFK